ncbi:MAG: SDR family NAD(P)-dependent oxidoreductase [Bacteroidales bacterium]
MDLKRKYGETALVAGASEGIGAAFASRLAAEGMNVVIVARRPEPLREFGDELAGRHKVEVQCIPSDLSEIDAAKSIEKKLNGKTIDLLVCNAALSPIGPFDKTENELISRAARLNMITPMDLVHSLSAGMLERGRGAIILMSSLAGFQGSGYLAVYAATKAFNRVLAESLWYEWKNRGVDVIACCAGATSTPGYINSRPGNVSAFAPRVLAPDEVVNECLRKLGRQPSVITGRGNRVASFVMQRLFSRKMAVSIMGDNTRKMYRF